MNRRLPRRISTGSSFAFCGRPPGPPGGSTTARWPPCAQTRAQLEVIAGVKRDVPVILHPDQDVPLGDVIDLYDLARLVGFDQIQFAASEPI